MKKVAKPLKIFISYGHEIGVKDESGNLYPEPNNESVVLQIKQYLESRGHEIWLDKERIKAGDDWRKAIYNGVEWSDVALICLSRKAMRPDGVCRVLGRFLGKGNRYPLSVFFPWTEEPVRPQSMELQRGRQDSVTYISHYRELYSLSCNKL